MDDKFQDRIDDYLLNRMDETAKQGFLQEVEQDEEKKEQLEFTRNVRDCICSREEKLQALSQFQQQYEMRRKAMAMCPTGTDSVQSAHYNSDARPEVKPEQSKRRMWFWIASVAAVLVIGFFAVMPVYNYEPVPNNSSPMEQGRGGDDVFDSVPMDSADTDTMDLNIETEVTSNE